MEKSATIARCLAALIVSVIIGIISATLITLLVATVNQWDDSPGGGFLLFGLMGFGTFCGFVAGVCLMVKIWRGRYSAATSKAHFVAIQIYLLSSTLLVGALLSVWTSAGSAGWFLAVILVAIIVILLWRAARNNSGRDNSETCTPFTK